MGDERILSNWLLILDDASQSSQGLNTRHAAANSLILSRILHLKGNEIPSTTLKYTIQSWLICLRFCQDDDDDVRDILIGHFASNHLQYLSYDDRIVSGTNEQHFVSHILRYRISSLLGSYFFVGDKDSEENNAKCLSQLFLTEIDGYLREYKPLQREKQDVVFEVERLNLYVEPMRPIQLLFEVIETALTNKDKRYPTNIRVSSSDTLRWFLGHWILGLLRFASSALSSTEFFGQSNIFLDSNSFQTILALLLSIKHMKMLENRDASLFNSIQSSYSNLLQQVVQLIEVLQRQFIHPQILSSIKALNISPSDSNNAV